MSDEKFREWLKEYVEILAEALAFEIVRGRNFSLNIGLN
jgi:hypothetical protein